MALKSLLRASVIVSVLISSTAWAQTVSVPPVFASRCALCHSADNADAPGPNLVEKAPADFNAFAQTVRSGRSGEMGDMPAFDTQTVSDAELHAIHAYLMAMRQQQQHH